MAASDATSIKQVIQEMAGKGQAEVLQGTVTSESPLKIQIANDDKLVIGSGSTYVPEHLTDYEMEVDIDGIAEGVKMTVYNALKKGDTVHLLSFKKGKQYYVLDRVK